MKVVRHKHIAQRSCRCPLPESIPGDTGWDFEQPGAMEGVAACGWGLELCGVPGTFQHKLLYGYATDQSKGFSCISSHHFRLLFFSTVRMHNENIIFFLFAEVFYLYWYFIFTLEIFFCLHGSQAETLLLLNQVRGYCFHVIVNYTSVCTLK